MINPTLDVMKKSSFSCIIIFVKLYTDLWHNYKGKTQAWCDGASVMCGVYSGIQKQINDAHVQTKIRNSSEKGMSNSISYIC